MKYVAFCDPSGGGCDSMTLAVAHLSLFRSACSMGFGNGVRHSVPIQCCEEFAGILATYRIHVIVGDRYSAQWVVERFRAHGVEYQHSPKTRSEIYGEFAALVNSGRVRMPVIEAPAHAVSKFRTPRFSHWPRRLSTMRSATHDDCANSAAGALTLAAGGLVPAPEPWSWCPSADTTPRRSAFEITNDPGPDRWWHKISTDFSRPSQCGGAEWGQAPRPGESRAPKRFGHKAENILDVNSTGGGVSRHLSRCEKRRRPKRFGAKSSARSNRAVGGRRDWRAVEHVRL